MITPEDLYSVLCAMTPLYFAMLLAFASVRYWKTFTPDQCSGINRFVAAFAVPVLSFHFISINDPYQMDLRFLLADSLAKIIALVLLSLWLLSGPRNRRQRLDWLITLFSVSTLPNTLVMGIPLLKAMYGDFTQELMVQLVVFQCVVWYTLLLFLFEYRTAAGMIEERFPGKAGGEISGFEVDGDVISLDGRDPIRTESEVEADGRVRVRIRRSTSSAPGSAVSSSVGLTPRLSNISGVEIYSVNTPGRNPTESPAFSSSDTYSIQPTPRPSNFNEAEAWVRSPAAGGWGSRQQSPAIGGRVTVVWESFDDGQGGNNVGEKDLSFRSTSKFAVRGEYDDEEDMADKSGLQLMPHPLIMMRLILTMVGRKLARNPNTYSSVLGLLWSSVSFKWQVSMPSLVENSIKIISDAGLGMAMFSLGLFMALQPRIISCGVKIAVMGMVIRFVIGPLMMSAASMAVGLRGVRLHTAIVQAALPQGIVPFVFAREYDLHPDILSTGVIFGMLVSLPVTLLYYIILGL